MLRFDVLLRSALLVVILSLFLAASAGSADARSAAPLSVPQATLDEALRCERLAASSREVVLFVPGTSETPAMFDWNWFRYADQRKWPYCTVALPESGTADAQTAAEYVTYSIRRVFALTGRRVQVVGHSQGGMLPRWSLKFWPDTRRMVDDLVGLAASNHGTELSKAPCASPDGCAESFWQQTIGSKFLTALNAGAETFSGISYTAAFTRYDEIVVPNQDAATGSTALRSGAGQIRNVLVQDVCPSDTGEHLAMGTFDATAHAIAVDALDHAGPADPTHVESSVCARQFQPGVNPATFGTDVATYAAAVSAATGGARRVRSEPELRCYVTNTCPASQSARARVSVSPSHIRVGRTTTVKLTGYVDRGNGTRSAAPGAVVVFGGRRVELDSKGHGTMQVRFGGLGLQKAAISVATVGDGRKTVRVVR